MDHLQSCAKAFEHLLDFQYHIIIGRKGKSVELNILFDPTEIEPFIQIENFLDSNKLIFRYNQKLQTFSLIEAEYLLSTPYENTDIYIFLDRQKEPGHFFLPFLFSKRRKGLYKRTSHLYTSQKRENKSSYRRKNDTVRSPHTQVKLLIHSTKYHHSPSSGSTCNAFCTVVNTRPFITPPCFLLWAADRTGYCTRIF